MTKRLKNVFEKICTKETFEQAYQNAIKGKKSRPEIIRFMQNKDVELENLRQEVIDGTYKVSGYHLFKLFSGGK